MLRLSRPWLRAVGRCYYDILGVPRDATTEDIKDAFKERAKQTHPDASSTSKKNEFQELVDAYRVLRNDVKRREYDRGRASKNERHSGAAGYGPSAGMHGSSDATATPAARNPAEGLAFAAVFFGGAFMLSKALQPNNFKDQDPHPRKAPARINSAVDPAALPTASQTDMAVNVKKSRTMMEQKIDNGFKVDGAVEKLSQGADDLVRAYYDPFFSKWYRIPEGYEPPSGMDLTAWHNKRTDPVEWSRLHAEGKLSEIIPRGGLQVRYLPGWKTFEPILIGDPVTGKTLRADKRLPASALKEKCEVQF